MKKFVLILCSGLIISLSASAQKKPNILFIIVDDQSPFDLKVYDPKSILETPNINKLAAEGIVFDAAHHMGSFSGAVCSPSRHMIMTGRTLWHLPKSGKSKLEPTVPPDIAQQTMGAVFNRASH